MRVCVLDLLAYLLAWGSGAAPLLLGHFKGQKVPLWVELKLHKVTSAHVARRHCCLELRSLCPPETSQGDAPLPVPQQRGEVRGQLLCRKGPGDTWVEGGRASTCTRVSSRADTQAGTQYTSRPWTRSQEGRRWPVRTRSVPQTSGRPFLEPPGGQEGKGARSTVSAPGGIG